ncbi:hypothetical protein GOBAR_AA01132 [Gossypium barbadense]|uniref:RRM domain-containing protein n=1 Tax=Gossypium barbadense TaxID=3634 RepID=A0A2P5YV13_GOSBA|nr:hypothetical protein GOBAR_AA01132 [Gossypium barbadense]
MAVAENAGAKIGSAGQNLESTVASANAPDKSKPRTDSVTDAKEANFQQLKPVAATINDGDSNIKMQNGFNKNQQQMLTKTAGCNEFSNMENGGDVYTNSGNTNGHTNRRKRNNFSQGKRRLNGRTNMAQQEDVIRKTVYVSDIDLQVTEELLAGLFLSCGPVVDCRICGDPNSVLRFAFVEFYNEGIIEVFCLSQEFNVLVEDARAALNLSGTILGYYPVRVLPSKTAIAPVNPTFLPRSEEEGEMCARTIYCTNIDKKVTQADVKLFFESVCGEVQCMRILGDYHHSSRIAFVEFTMAESAITALNCSGAVLGSLPIRVSPSKTPIRLRALLPAMN